MKLQAKKIGNIIEVFLAGRLDVELSLFIEKEIHQLTQSEPECHLLLNLAEVKYMSSSGIRIFVSTMRILNDTTRKLKLCNLSDPVKKYLKLLNYWICLMFILQRKKQLNLLFNYSSSAGFNFERIIKNS